MDPAAENDWSFLPFMALSDGAHAYDSKSNLPTFELNAEPLLGLPKTSPTSLFAGKEQPQSLPRPSSVYHVRGRWMQANYI